MTRTKPEILLGLADSAERGLMIQALHLAAPGRSLCCASDGASALDLLFSGPRAFSLQMSIRFILLDLALPKMNGLSVLRCLKSHHKTREIPVILCAKGANPHEERQCVAQGADGYFIIPEGLDELSSCITAQVHHWLPPRTACTPKRLPQGTQPKQNGPTEGQVRTRNQTVLASELRQSQRSASSLRS